MDLNKYIVKNDGNRPFHSSGYARVANGDNVGSTSDITFNQRLEIDHNRRLVGSYKRSLIGSATVIPRIRSVSRQPVKHPRPVRTVKRPVPASVPKKRGIFF